jgi:ketosteroid isomerase-like protein
MSQENVEIVRRTYETDDPDPDLYDAEAVFDNSNAIDPGVYRGLDQIREFYDAQGEMWESQRYEPQEFIPIGVDQVVVSEEIVSVGRDGVEVVARVATLCTLRAGKITHLKTFQTKADALEAAGLSE